MLPLRMGTNQYACFTERNPKGRGEEPGNWSFRIQLGSTSSKGLPVLFQGLPPGFFLLIIIIIYSNVAAAAISQLSIVVSLCFCRPPCPHPSIPATSPTVAILHPASHKALECRLKTSTDPPIRQPSWPPLQAVSADSLHRGASSVRAPNGLHWRHNCSPYDMETMEDRKGGGPNGWADRLAQ